ncbi:hypothetical protein PsorP6_006155 [Peronosclerospora sorghi]|uniref:Uncharacterized protein n=1 Tax=Peronosclerospora sorghi TaxID=230839 RepID=A0ACC0W5H1_9STRA|nr:hypothetical protein PsorP6_006155 [Peronosclerospora sorghi]
MKAYRNVEKQDGRLKGTLRRDRVKSSSESSLSDTSGPESESREIEDERGGSNKETVWPLGVHFIASLRRIRCVQVLRQRSYFKSIAECLMKTTQKLWRSFEQSKREIDTELSKRRQTFMCPLDLTGEWLTTHSDLRNNCHFELKTFVLVFAHVNYRLGKSKRCERIQQPLSDVS